MFEGIRDDFDPRYWTRALAAVLVASSTAVFLGAAWMLTELFSRIAWFLAELLLKWLFPPQLALALQPLPPVTLALSNAVAERDLMNAIDTTTIDLDDGVDFDYNPDPGPDYSLVEAPPDPSLRAEEVMVEQLMQQTAIIGILGSFEGDELDGGSPFADILAVGSLDDLSDGALVGIGGVIGNEIVGFEPIGGIEGGGVVGGIEGGVLGGLGSGGIGTLGTGGGGSGDGVGGLGTRGGGIGSGGIGSGVPEPHQSSNAKALNPSRPELTSTQLDWLSANGSASCKVDVLISSSGRPKRVRARSGCPEILRKAALRAAESSTYKPAMEDGTPIESTLPITVHFNAPI